MRSPGCETVASEASALCRILPIYVDQLSSDYAKVSVEVCPTTSCEQLISCVLEQLQLSEAAGRCQLMECVFDGGGQPVQQRVLALEERPLLVSQHWPHAREANTDCNLHRFYVCHKHAQMSFPVKNMEMPLASSAVALSGHSTSLELRLRVPSGPDTILSPGPNPNLCQLAELTEQTLLDSLHERFRAGHIYTFVSSILVALNPFAFAAIYNPKQVMMYRNRRLHDLPPHIFAIADAAYQRLLSSGVSQSVVISGESGSGKTVSSTLLLHHLTALSQRGTRANGVVQNILAAGPVMGAFGSAKTAYNDDSSRFGKFIEVQYKTNGQVCGAVVQKYLLERSRIVRQSTSERNYHVFYYLLYGAGEELRSRLHLLNPASYCYLNQSHESGPDHLEEKYEFTRLVHSMKTVGFSAEQRDGIFSLLSAILLMGNIIYENMVGDHHDEFVRVRNTELVEQVAELLAVDKQLLDDALTCKQTRISGELVVINYRMTEALTARDSMAKCMYAALFDWIIQQLNRSLSVWSVGSDCTECKSIGVLDIFGFEDFGNSNSFEQFCINYANERLQYYFIQHLFLYEQLVYQTEGIWWRNIEFSDNVGCIQLYEHKTRGLLNILDDTCSFPGATNETLLLKFSAENRHNSVYGSPPKFEMAFFINHYAGKVKYQIAEFREKNLDLMRPAIVSVLKSSQNTLIRHLISYSARALFRWSVLRHLLRAVTMFRQMAPTVDRARADSELVHRAGVRTVARSLSAPNIARLVSESGDVVSARSHFQQLNSRPQRPAVKNVARRPASTVVAQFQQSLQKLMDTLSSTQPYFVRCIRSNVNKEPNRFDVNTVSRQLRYTGMLETVRIRQCGYDVRISYEECVRIYGPIIKQRQPYGSLLKRTGEILSASGVSSSCYQLGCNRLFIREPGKVCLDLALDKVLVYSAAVIQRWFRRVSARRRQLLLLRSVTRIQSYMRGFSARRDYHTLRVRHMAAILIQKVWRGYYTRRSCVRIRRAALMLPLKPVTERIPDGYISTPDSVTTPPLPHLHSAPIRSSRGGKLARLYKQSPLSPNSVELSYDASSIEDITGDSLLKDALISPTSDDLTRDVSSPGDVNDDILLKDSLISPASAELSRDASPLGNVNVDCLLSSLTPNSELLSKYVSPSGDVRDDNRSNDPLLSPTSEPLSPDVRLPGTSNRRKSAFVRNSSIRLASRLRCEKRPAVPPPPIPSDVTTAKHTGVLTETPSTITPVINGTSLPACHSPPPVTDITVGDSTRSSQQKQQHKPDIERKAAAKTYLHRMHRTSRMPRNQTCSFCSKPITNLFVLGFKCSFCRHYFHPLCLSSASDQTCPALAHTLQSEHVSTSEMVDHKKSVIADVVELRMLQSLIYMKIGYMELSDKKGQVTSADRVFVSALRLFHAKLSQLNVDSVSVPGSNPATAVGSVDRSSHDLRYGDLVEQFTEILKQCVDEASSDFPVTVGVNAFRAYLNEFIDLLESPTKAKRKRRRKKTKTGHGESTPLSLHGHMFSSTVVNIPTACEICSKPLWLMERGYVCSNCKLTCHKKCQPKVKRQCYRPVTAITGDSGRVYGRDLVSIMSDDDVLPLAISRLLTAIERRGLRIQGVYRKSGSKRCIDELQRSLDADPQYVLSEAISVHALTGAVKAWLRQLPEPLLTFSLYSDWLRAGLLTDSDERAETLYQLLSQLPACNCRVMEQLLFHLSRVALHEAENMMSPRALAIVMSQCLLRPEKPKPAQDLLNDVQAQSQCVESLIAERLRRLRVTLKNIESLDDCEESGLTTETESDAEACRQRQQLCVPEGQEEVPSPKRSRQRILATALSQLSGAISEDDDVSHESDSVDELECFRATVRDN